MATKKAISELARQLSPMQSFFLNLINISTKELHPCYMAYMWYESIGKRRHVASRDAFGQTSAAYRTCRKLTRLSLIQEVRYKTSSGHSYTMYSKK